MKSIHRKPSRAGGCFAGGALNWDWFMNGRRAGIFVSLLGRTAARILYVVLGLLIAGAGVAGALGLIG